MPIIHQMQVELHPALETVKLFGLGSSEDGERFGDAFALREAAAFVAALIGV